jgi:AcrR family transcriptional regulator
MESARNQPLPRGRHHLTREEVQASQRTRILEAMIEEVAARGYAATSVAHITTRAGVSRKSFYEQFADKRDCYYAAYEMAARIQGREVMRAARHLDPRTEPIEFFRVLLRAFLESVAAHPAAARTLLVEAYALGPGSSRADVARRHDESMAAFLAPLGYVDARGRLTFDGRVIVASLAAMITRLVAEGRTEEAPELCDPFVDWVARHRNCVPAAPAGTAAAAGETATPGDTGPA